MQKNKQTCLCPDSSLDFPSAIALGDKKTCGLKPVTNPLLETEAVTSDPHGNHLKNGGSGETKGAWLYCCWFVVDQIERCFMLPVFLKIKNQVFLVGSRAVDEIFKFQNLDSSHLLP